MTSDRYAEGVRDGWLQAASDAGKCGAHNLNRATTRPSEFALCIRERGHTGKHDDSWRTWGDRDATADANQATAAADRRRLLGQPR